MTEARFNEITEVFNNSGIRQEDIYSLLNWVYEKYPEEASAYEDYFRELEYEAYMKEQYEHQLESQYQDYYEMTR